MTVKFEKFEEGGYEFTPASNNIEYFEIANTNGIRFYIETGGKFIGYLDLFMSPGKKEAIWRLIEGDKKFLMPIVRESLNAVEAGQGHINQSVAEKAAKAAVKRHFKSKFPPSWKFSSTLSRLPLNRVMPAG